MSDINITVTPSNSVSVSAGVGTTSSISAGSLAIHADSHLSGGRDAINHNNLYGLQGGSSSERYHLTKEQYDSLGGDGSFDFVSLTGDQTISGIKTFVDRPLVNGTGVMLSGEAAPLPTTIVYQTGDQNISGVKTFVNNVLFSSNVGIGTNTPTSKLDISDTWNSAGTTFTGVKLNITDTASSASSLLMDLQVGGTSLIKATKAAEISFVSKGKITSWNDGDLDVFNNAGTRTASLGTNGIRSFAGQLLSLSTDVILVRDAANTLAQRNGANAQTFRLYNTYTDASNYERGFLRWDTNVLKIGTEKLGTGTARQLEFQTDGSARMTITSSGNIGIGTTTPEQLLHVNGTIKAYSSLRFQVNAEVRSESTGGGQSLKLIGCNGTPNGFIDLIPSTSANSTGEYVRISGGPSGTTEIARFLGTGNVGIGTTTPSAPLTIYRSGANLPAFRLEDGDITIPDYSSVGFNPSLSLNTVGHVTALGSTIGGVQFQGFSNSSDPRALAFAGHSGNTSPTSNPVVSFQAWKHDGSTNRTALIGNEIAFDFASGTNSLIRILGGGNVGIGTTTPAAKLDISDTTGAASGSLAASALNISQTWNTTGAPAAIKLNVTDTASSASSLLMDLQVGSVSKFNISKIGKVNATEFWATASFSSGASGGFYNQGFDIELNRDGLKLGVASYLSWYSNKTYNTRDLVLVRDAADTLAQRNSTNAQTFRLYNTYTDASNYERLGIVWSGNTATIRTESAGSGVSRSLILGVGNGGQWFINSAGGHLGTYGSDGVYDIGAPSSNRPRNIYIAGHLSAATKSFKIPHQTKSGYLQYGVVESNEHSVYVRGESSENTITLPDHWEWLVDEDSITVQLTSVGKFMPLYIIDKNNKKVTIGGVEGTYNYTIYGTRKDVPDLIVETEE